jgi:hypothetical protein
MEFVVNAAIFDRIVQSHPNIDVANIFRPAGSNPDKEEESDSESDTADEKGILYLRIVMGKPIGKVSHIFLFSVLTVNYHSNFANSHNCFFNK